jgi:hypothetical protein
LKIGETKNNASSISSHYTDCVGKVCTYIQGHARNPLRLDIYLTFLAILTNFRRKNRRIKKYINVFDFDGQDRCTSTEDENEVHNKSLKTLFSSHLPSIQKNGGAGLPDTKYQNGKIPNNYKMKNQMA